ncbi:MAG: fibronectin-binding autotransporter adhesin, partial [Lentimonas sp.]
MKPIQLDRSNFTWFFYSRVIDAFRWGFVVSIFFPKFFGRGSRMILWSSTAIACGLFAAVGPVSALDLLWNNVVPDNNATIETTDGAWNATDTSWSVAPVVPAAFEGAANQAFTVGATAIFTETPSLVTSDGTAVPSGLTFSVAGYTIAGTLKYGLALAIDAADDTLSLATAGDPDVTISAALNGVGDITKSGVGVVAVSGDNTGATGNLSVNAGSMVSTGNYGGTVGVAFGAALDVNGGTVSGLVTNSGGTVEIGGATFAMGVAVTTGTVTVDGNSTVDGTGIVNTGGTVIVDAPRVLTGDVRNNGATTVVNNGQIIGDVTNAGAGTTTNAGLIDGDMTVSAGAFNNETGGSISGAATASAGTVGANGGSFDGGLTVGGSATLNIT